MKKLGERPDFTSVETLNNIQSIDDLQLVSLCQKVRLLTPEFFEKVTESLGPDRLMPRHGGCNLCCSVCVTKINDGIYTGRDGALKIQSLISEVRDMDLFKFLRHVE